MDFRWLQDFLSLAETGSFTAAAETQHSSQPAFSRRIQALETWLGAELIDRTRYPTTLTAAGEQFRKQAAEMVQRLIDARGELHGDPVGGPETITIALPHTLAITRFPGWWTGLTRHRMNWIIFLPKWYRLHKAGQRQPQNFKPKLAGLSKPRNSI